MNSYPGHGQPGSGQDANLYGYSNAQDDFSTPFNNDASAQLPGFSDTGSFMNPGFHSHFDQQMDAGTHDSISSDFLPQNAPQPWQQSHFFDPSQLGNYPGLPASSTPGFKNHYGHPANSFNDVQDNSNFTQYPSQPSFEAPPRQQSSTATINPHAIQTASDYVFQQPAAAPSDPALKSESGQATSGQPLSQLPTIQASTTAPRESQNKYLDTDLTQAIESAVPAVTKSGPYSILQRDQFRSPVDVQPLKKFKFVNLSKDIYDSPEARVIPPTRREFWPINELDRRLNSDGPAAADLKAKKLLEGKISKARHRAKPVKAPKQRKATVSAGDAGSKAAPVEDVSDGDSAPSTSSDESDYVSDSDEVIEEEPSPLPPSRPADPVQAQEYDVLKAVWARSAVRIGPDDVRRRLATYLDVVKRVRTAWKNASSPDIAAAKRKEFEQILRLTVKHGHHNIIESIDRLTPLAVIISSAVTELLKANNYADGLLEAALELLITIPNLDPDFLKTTKLDKHKDRICKKAQGRIKDLASLIEIPSEGQTLTSSTPKQVQTVDSKDVTAVTGAQTMARSSSSQASAIKKPAEQAMPPAKKPATSTVESKKLPVNSLAARKAPLVMSKPAAAVQSVASKATAKAGPVKLGDKASSATVNGAAPKTTMRTITPAKTSSIFSSLTSASKKPGTSLNATVAAVPKAPVPKSKTPEPKPAPTSVPAKPAFSFASTLANLGKPKDEPKKNETKEKLPPETDEQRTKRLRKEERRKLRVKWKPDEELCAVRIFDHRQDDETEHEMREVADAADLKSEGQAFKRQLLRYTVQGVEDDEEQEYIPWYDPRSTDFSVVYQRKAGDMEPPPQNLETRANGSVKLNSPESEAQTLREQAVMIEIYPSIMNVPPHPKEPADPFTGKSVPQYDFGAIRDCHAYPPVPARLDERNQELLRQYAYRMNATAQPTQPVADISSILATLGQTQPAAQMQYQPPQPQYNMGNAPPSDMAALLAQFSAPQQQAAPPQQTGNSIQDAINLFNSMQGAQVPQAPMPSVPQPPQQQQHVPNSELSSILASLAAGTGQVQAQAPAPQPMMQPQAQPQAHTEAVPGVDPSLLGWLAQYNAGSNGAAPMAQEEHQQAQPTSMQPSWPSFGTSGSGQAASASDWLHQMSALNGQQANGMGGGNERKRGFEDDAAQNDGGKKKKKPFYGVPRVPCRYYKEGRCQKGPECTFLHE